MDSSEQIIDFHTHFYPGNVSDNPREFALGNGEPFWGALVAPEHTSGLQGWASPESMLATMNESGVGLSVLQGWYWENSDTCALQNHWYLDLISTHPQCFKAFAAINPKDVKASLASLDWAHKHGFCGIGELHPAVQGFELDDKQWFPIVEFAVEKQWPISIHVTEAVGRNYSPRKETNLRAIQTLVETFPDLKLVLAHWGGLVFFHELNPYIKKTWQNVFYDTAASPLLYEQKIFALADAVLPKEKILFGSDFPLKIFPAKADQNPLALMIEQIRALGLDREVSNAWLSANAQRLLKAE